jgi:hypothetical protein
MPQIDLSNIPAAPPAMRRTAATPGSTELAEPRRG